MLPPNCYWCCFGLDTLPDHMICSSGTHSFRGKNDSTNAVLETSPVKASRPGSVFYVELVILCIQWSLCILTDLVDVDVYDSSGCGILICWECIGIWELNKTFHLSNVLGTFFRVGGSEVRWLEVRALELGGLELVTLKDFFEAAFFALAASLIILAALRFAFRANLSASLHFFHSAIFRRLCLFICRCASAVAFRAALWIRNYIKSCSRTRPTIDSFCYSVR